MYMIEATGLSKTYRTRVKGEGLSASLKSLIKPQIRMVQAVQDIDLQVQPGEIVAFIGPNGAGKSTTIKMLTGILHPNSGHIRVLGLDPVKERSRLSYHIGTVFGQKSQLWFHLPPIDSFALLGKIYDVDPIQYRKRIKDLTDRAGLLFYTLFIYVFFSLWRAIYQGGEVQGYTLTQVVWYLCMTELLVFGCKTPVFNQMNEDIKSGAMAYQLNRPYHYIWYQFAGSLGSMLYNLVVFGMLAIFLGLIMVGPLPDYAFVTLPLGLISGLLGIVINFFLLMSLGLTAFRMEENSAFFLVYQKLVFMLGMFIPLEFLPDWLQRIARWLPFPYVAWAPARLIVAFSWDLFREVLPMQLFWAVLAILLAHFSYRAGVRGVQANGG